MKTQGSEIEVSSMEEYVEDIMGNGETGDPYYVDSVNTEGVAVFGKRVFEWNTQGFRTVERFDSRDKAREYADEWNRDRFAPSNMFTTTRVVYVDLSEVGLEGETVEYRCHPRACTVNIYYNGTEVDVFTLGEPEPDFDAFENECRDHFASSDFVGGE